jgi:hypothetical protein
MYETRNQLMRKLKHCALSLPNLEMTVLMPSIT